MRLRAMERGPTNLPAQTSPLIGRERELEAATELLLRDDVRLVTFNGSGGSGKTRLSVEVARRLGDKILGGIFFVPLAPVSDFTLLASEILNTLQVTEKKDKPLIESLKDYLKDKRTLLVLDNFEHLLPAAPVVSELLNDCPRLKVLVTSRAPLRIRGEREFSVLPLPLPNLRNLPAVEELLNYAGIALFVQRAQNVRADFTVTSENARTIAEICAKVDGLPLALELAAARIRVLSPEEMLKLLEKRLQILKEGPPDLPARQRTLRDTIVWSYDLLDADDKRRFRRLAAFVGGCSLDAAEAVCEEPGTIEGLSRLVERNLLRREEVDGESRFLMLETIREFALETLATSDELKGTMECYADHFVSLAEKAEPELRGPKQASWSRCLDREQDNLREALGWLMENRDAERSLRLLSSLWYFWYIRGHWTEGRTWLTRALKDFGSGREALLARVLRGAGVLASVQDDFPAARSYLEESLELFMEIGDKEGTALTLNSLGLTLVNHGDVAEGESSLEQSLAIMQKMQNPWGIALVLNNLGVSARSRGENDKAIRLHKQSLQLFRELGDKRHIARMLINLGINARDKAEHDEARKLLSESLSVSRELGEKVGVAESLLYLGSVERMQATYDLACSILAESLTISFELGDKELVAECLDEFARCACARGDAGRGARLFAACETLRHATGLQIAPAYRANRERDVSGARTMLGEEGFATEWVGGKAMSVEEAVKYALAPLSGAA